MKKEDLHPYQLNCVNHIIQNKYCGVFIDMGLGKTVSTLTAIDALMFDYCEINSVLVVAPKRVVESVWEEEAKKWEHLNHLTFSKIIGTEKQRINALSIAANIYLISRDNIVWLYNYLGEHNNLHKSFDMCVIDELSSFKSYKSLRFKALKFMRPTFKRLVGLTGTPAPNSLLDLWPQIYLMDQGARLGKSISRYRDTYFKSGWTNGHIVYNYVLRQGCDKAIQNKIKDICISMRAQDYLQLPMRVDNFIKVPMPRDEKIRYDNFERERVLELLGGSSSDEITAANAASLSNKLLQYANGAVYDDKHVAHEVNDLKLSALKDLVEEANGNPVLIAWSFQFDRDRIKEALSKYNPRELKTAQDIKDWNEGKIQVLLAHPASAGHGLNLQAGGNIIIWYGLTWSLELYQQFNARLHRQGQKSTVIVNHLIMEDTHDMDVIKALSLKNKGQEALMESIKAKIDKYKINFKNDKKC